MAAPLRHLALVLLPAPDVARHDMLKAQRQAVDRIVHRYRQLGAVLLDPDVGDDELRVRLLSTVPEAQLREDQSDLANWLHHQPDHPLGPPENRVRQGSRPRRRRRRVPTASRRAWRDARACSPASRSASRLSSSTLRTASRCSADAVRTLWNRISLGCGSSS